MGIYDRDYYREQQRPGVTLRAPQSIVVTLIIINVAAFLANGLLTGETNRITAVLACNSNTLSQPWMWWQLLTYGFAHGSIQHILFNMLGLWFLGMDIEHHYGRKEFLRLYLAMIVVGGLTWALGETLLGHNNGMVIGASGAIAGIVVLYALNFPRRTLLLFFVLPVPAWLVGVLVVLSDLFGAAGHAGDSNIAYTVHLAGAALAFSYYHFGWNFSKLTEGRFSLSRFKPRPKLRVHDPQLDKPELSDEVDRILEKIHREGEDSLSRKERRTLESASREYRKRQ